MKLNMSLYVACLCKTINKVEDCEEHWGVPRLKKALLRYFFLQWNHQDEL